MTLGEALRSWFRPEPVFAHCDVPCGIYDPHEAQVAAHTVVRMCDLIAELPSKGLSPAEERNAFVRYVQTKEAHAERVKHEVRIIWGDYFKEEHLQPVPDLHALVWRIMKLGSKARQSAEKKTAEDLLGAVNQFAEAYWKTKQRPTARAKAPYPTDRELVLPKLS